LESCEALRYSVASKNTSIVAWYPSVVLRLCFKHDVVLMATLVVPTQVTPLEFSYVIVSAALSVVLGKKYTYQQDL
jgi:hypothetical protein